MSETKKDFFKRKDPVSKPEIPIPGDYDLTNFDNDLASCGINDVESFENRHKELFNNLIVDSSSENAVATVAKKIEESFSKREIAFLMSKDLLMAAYNKSREEIEQQVKKSN